MKIYTRTGDEGTTSLFAGGRVAKHHLRVESYGTVDELNSYLGLIRSQLQDATIDVRLQRVQNELFVVGADLATPMNQNPEWLKRLSAETIPHLERDIDQLDEDLEPLTAFVLPGGTTIAAHTHVARTVCRRAERLCVALAAEDDINPLVIKYLNRLSDFLFTLARWLNKKANEPEVRWHVRND